MLSFSHFAIISANETLAGENKLQELTGEEVTAIMNNNCSVAYLNDGEENDNEVQEFQCQIALWFTGEYPKWFETSNFIEEMERATEEELDHFAPGVCDCGIIDISDLCPNEVEMAAQKLIDRCPRNKVITGLSRQGKKYFDEQEFDGIE